jgi:hypothetical protein
MDPVVMSLPDGRTIRSVLVDNHGSTKHVYRVSASAGEVLRDFETLAEVGAYLLKR